MRATTWRRGALAAALAAAGALVGCRGDEPPATVRRQVELLPFERGVIRVAGSGGMTPLARALGLAFRSALPGAPRVVVEDSIGSGGGVRATIDGAVDVGLITRRLNPTETVEALRVLPVGRDAVVFAAHPDVGVEGVSAEELLDIYSGRRRTFADGSPVTVLLRDRGESANLAIDVGIPGMAGVREQASKLGFRVLYHDDAMAAALAVTPGAIGVFAYGLLRETRIPLKVLRLDGKLPSRESLADGTWPLARPLALVMRADRLEYVRTFLRFVVSPEGTRIIENLGCLSEPSTGAGSREPLPAGEFGQAQAAGVPR